jgi:hypothetical protein
MAYSFVVGDEQVEDFGSTPLQVKVTLEEGDFNGDGIADVRVSLDTVSGNLADLRGFFFNLADDSLLQTIQVSGDQVTAVGIDSDNDGNADISSVGSQTTQAVINPMSFEGGISLGTAGLAADDLQSVSFVLSSPTTQVTYDDLVGESIGIRATSVFDGDGREGSSKLTAVVPPPPVEPPSVAYEGLSHGFWKNHASAWDLPASTSFESFFSVDANWLSGSGKKATTLADVTFEQALGLQGGGMNALAREATAAILNATEHDINYKFAVGEIVSMVHNAFMTGAYEETKNLLEAQNTLGTSNDWA